MPRPDPRRDRSIADLTPRAVPAGIPIGALAEQSGLSESVLRIWEQRYGWPRPRRLPNGYHMYDVAIIPLLRAVHDELKDGKTIGDLLRDPHWSAILEAGRLPPPPGAVQDGLRGGKPRGALLRDPQWSAILEAGRPPATPASAKPRPDWGS